MKKNVLIYGPYKSNGSAPQPGGIAKWLFSFLNDPFLNEAIDYSVIDTSVLESRWKKKSRFRFIMSELKRWKKIKKDTIRFLKKQTFDLIHFHCSCGALGIIRDYYILKIIKKKRIKIITHFHCNLDLQANVNKITRYFFRKVVSLSSASFVLNERSAAAISKLNRNSKCYTIPNFIPENEIRNNSKSINIELKTLLFVGFITKNKGIKEIYEVANKLPNLKFRLIGNMYNDIKTLAVPENVVLLGPLERHQIIKELDNADVFLFPSYTEGFSLALLEAMARGLPIICTDVGANKEMISTNRGGFCVPVENVDEIFESIKKMESAQLRKEFSIFNLKKVKENYLSTIVISRILSIYANI